MIASDTVTIAAIGAAVVPLVVSFLKQQKWSAQVKQLVAGACSVAVAAIGVAVTTHNWGTVNLSELATMVFTGSQLVYGAYFRGSVVETQLAAIGRKPAVTTPPA